MKMASYCENIRTYPIFCPDLFARSSFIDDEIDPKAIIIIYIVWGTLRPPVQRPPNVRLSAFLCRLRPRTNGSCFLT